MKKFLHYLKKFGPWLMAVLIFGYLFHLYPPSKVLSALTYVNLWTFSAFAVGYFVFIFIVDSWVTARVISEFSHKVSFKDIAYARGFTYLIMIINYPASQAAFAYYLKRRYKIPIFQALGVFFFIIFIDLMWIVTLAFAGSFFQDYTIGSVDLGHTVKIFSACAYSFALLWLAFWRRWIPLDFEFIERFRKRKAFHIFERAKVFDYIKVAVWRIPIHFTIIISMYVVLKTFNVSIPFTKILGNVPLVFFLGTLPITPGGLGTTNAAMVELLYRHISGPIFDTGAVTPQEMIFAASLLWMFANYLLKVITGTLMLKRVSTHLFAPTTEEPEEEVEHEAAHVGGNI